MLCLSEWAQNLLYRNIVSVTLVRLKTSVGRQLAALIFYLHQVVVAGSEATSH